MDESGWGRSTCLAIGAGGSWPPSGGCYPGLLHGGLRALRGWTGPPRRHDSESTVDLSTKRVRTVRVHFRTRGFSLAVNTQGSVNGVAFPRDAPNARFSLADSIVRPQYLMHRTHKARVSSPSYR